MCEMELDDSFSSSGSELNNMENSSPGLVVHCQTEAELQSWFRDLEVGKLALTCHFALDVLCILSGSPWLSLRDPLFARGRPCTSLS